GPASSRVALAGGPTATSARAAATSSAASGCMGASGRRTVPPSAPASAIPPRNSKNCVARTIVYGTLPPPISLSWATFPQVPAVRDPVGPPHRQRDVVPHASRRFRGKEVARRFLEELQHGPVLERRGVRHIDHDSSAREHLGQPFARERVDAGRA